MIYKSLVDIVCLVFIFILMAYRLTENSVHELMGIGLFILLIIHQLLNRTWYQNIFQGKYNARRMINTTVNILMLIAMVVVITTAIPISRDIFVALKIQNGMIVSQIHILSAYWLFVLVAVHLGLHGYMLINILRKFVGDRFFAQGSSSYIILKFLMTAISIYGIYATYSRNLLAKLIMYYTFDAWRLEEAVLVFLVDYLSIMMLCAVGAYYSLKLVMSRKK